MLLEDKNSTSVHSELALANARSSMINVQQGGSDINCPNQSRTAAAAVVEAFTASLSHTSNYIYQTDSISILL